MKITRFKKPLLLIIAIVLIVIFVLIFVKCDGDNTNINGKTTDTTSIVTSETETEVVTTEEETTIVTETPAPEESEVVEGTVEPVTTPVVTTAATTEPVVTTTSDPNWLGAPEVTINTATTSAPVVEPTTSIEPDTSLLTWTDADVGKVVGYDGLTNKDITVINVEERVNGLGLKGITVYYSNGNAVSVVECEYCHEFPCPDGGGTSCSQYNVKNDATITCQRCGRLIGDGYNGTCYGTIDWDNGGKTTCNHYD